VGFSQLIDRAKLLRTVEELKVWSLYNTVHDKKDVAKLRRKGRMAQAKHVSDGIFRQSILWRYHYGGGGGLNFVSTT
jgi:hypothetical protein